MKKTIRIFLAVMGSLLITQCYGQETINYDSLSTGMTSSGAYVLSLAMKDSGVYSPVYAGGHFSVAGRKTAANIAEWTDTLMTSIYPDGDWAPLGSGVDSDVCALAMFNNYLYAGGKFDTAGGIASSHIARWDTAALAWDSLRGALNGNVYALCVYHNALYVGGDFTMANGITVNRIAIWNDSVWSAADMGFDTGAVYALTVSNDTLYAGGSFIKANGLVVNHLAKWGGSGWQAVQGGTNNTVYALTDYYSQALFVGGAFTQSGSVLANYISSLNYYDNSWYSLGAGTNDTVRALTLGSLPIITIPGKLPKHLYSGEGELLLIGGNFDSAGGNPADYFAAYFPFDSWNTISYSTLSGPVFALASPVNFITGYVGGEFYQATVFSSPITLNNVAYIGGEPQGGGIQSINNNSLVNVYPNPNNGKFTLQIKNGQMMMDKEEIQIYNVLGEQVYSKSYQPSANGYQPISIDLSSQPNGVYLYRVVAENGELAGKGKVIINK